VVFMQYAEKLPPPDHFPFPFKPYAIQQDFMRELYTTLEDGKIGLFESPTGTVLRLLPCNTVFISCWHLGKIHESDLWCTEVAER